METDPNGHRVNLAIVTVEKADQVVMLPPVHEGGRAAFGLRFGSTIFYDIHAISGGGIDAPEKLAQTDTYADAHGYNWMALGDLNRDPATLNETTLPANTVTNSTNETTYINRGEYDYAVEGPGVRNLFIAERLDNRGGSDHWPVGFQAPTASTTTQFTLEAYQTRPAGSAATSVGTNPGMLAVEANTTSTTNAPSGYPTDVVAPAGGPGDGSSFRWTNITDGIAELQDVGTGDCITAGNATTAAPCTGGLGSRRPM